jgi:Uncharacterised nucleotidyltransferase
MPASGDPCGSSGADYALLARSLGTNDRAGALAALARVAADPALVATLRRHHLIALLGATIAEDDLRTHLPPGACAALHAWLRQPRSSPERSLQTIAEAQAALRRDGVDCMLLKGLYFADRLYGGLDRRGQYDVDLLVRWADFRKAARSLRALGYLERWRDLHSATWQRETDYIDLHACFRNAPPYRLDEARTWRERVPYTLAGISGTTPSDEDTLVMLALSLFQDVGLGTVKLKQLLDVYLLAASIDARFDWPGFFARRAPERTRGIAVNVLDLVRRVFGGESELGGLAAALDRQRAPLVVSERAEALALVLGARPASRNKAWFFAIYPGSIVWYWLWLLPRKLPTYLSGKAPGGARSSMRPSLEALRVLIAARRRAPAAGRGSARRRLPSRRAPRAW